MRFDGCLRAYELFGRCGLPFDVSASQGSGNLNLAGVLCRVAEGAERLPRLTVLRQQHLKFFLLTVDPQVAGLAIRVSEGGLTGMRMHGKEPGGWPVTEVAVV